MNWEPSMDPYELRESIGENLEETCQHGDKAFPLRRVPGPLPAGKGRLSLALA